MVLFFGRKVEGETGLSALEPSMDVAVTDRLVAPLIGIDIGLIKNWVGLYSVLGCLRSGRLLRVRHRTGSGKDHQRHQRSHLASTRQQCVMSLHRSSPGRRNSR